MKEEEEVEEERITSAFINATCLACTLLCWFHCGGGGGVAGRNWTLGTLHSTAAVRRRNKQSEVKGVDL